MTAESLRGYRARTGKLQVAADWASALAGGLLVITALFLCADFGGVYWWSHYVASLAIIAATLLACPTAILSPPVSFKAFAPVVLLAVCVGYAYLQTIPVPSAWVKSLSPASHLAHTSWVEPFIGVRTHFPISIDVERSRHAVAVLSILLAASWIAAHAFRTPERAVVMIGALALGGAAFSVHGILRQINPEWDVWGVEMKAASFSTFVNRNNAALILNYGLGSGLGLIAWRVATLKVNLGPSFAYVVRLDKSLLMDWWLIVSSLLVFICVAGLLVCGSRGGLIAGAVAVVVAAAAFTPQIGSGRIAVAVCCVAVLLLSLAGLSQTSLFSLERLAEFDLKKPGSLLADTRTNHWRDGWETLLSHWPAGSGASTYQYAYLPFQDLSDPRWFTHADNIWLEFACEFGVVGLLLGSIVLVSLSVRIMGFYRTTEPVRVGIATMVLSVLTATAISQTFDFGIKLLPLGMIFVLLLTLVFRATDPTDCGVTRKPKVQLHDHVLGLLVALCVLAGLIFAANRLRKDATAVHLIAQVESNAAEIASGQRPLGYGSVEISAAELAFDSTRLTIALDNYSDMVDSLSGNELTQGRSEKEVSFVAIRLSSRPLAIERRLTDFVGTHNEVTALEQSVELNTKNPDGLFELASFAAKRDLHHLSHCCARRCLELDFRLTSRVFELYKNPLDQGKVSPADIFPNEPKVELELAEIVLRHRVSALYAATLNRIQSAHFSTLVDKDRQALAIRMLKRRLSD